MKVKIIEIHYILESEERQRNGMGWRFLSNVVEMPIKNECAIKTVKAGGVYYPQPLLFFHHHKKQAQ